jgi:hypothetical protein
MIKLYSKKKNLLQTKARPSSAPLLSVISLFISQNCSYLCFRFLDSDSDLLGEEENHKSTSMPEF